MTRRLALLAVFALGFAACTLKDEASGVPQPIPAPPDVAAAPADAQRTESGLASKVLQVGLGSSHPKPETVVVVHYTGWTTDGHMFDSSVAKREPAIAAVRQFIPGWVEGLQLMVVGEKRRFWIPGQLAYGPDEQHRIGSGPIGTLVFDVELLAIR